ncbi:MAG: DNA-formamidopyrimidine glycosylase family protein [Actinomycetota bacterium]
MPECLEAEIWRRAAESVVGRLIERLEVDERVSSVGLVASLTGRRITSVRRLGKVLLVDTDGPTLGLHFGMTGRLVVDGAAPIEQLEYSSGADRDDWDRLRLFTDGGAVPAVRMNDPRRLGRLSLDPDLSHLGPDAMSLGAGELRDALRGRRRAIKPTLLDQSVIAGLGNLCADEVLFTAGVPPSRPSDRLSHDDIEAIAAACRDRLGAMLEAGGSTHGVLDPDVRRDLPPCPRCGGELRRASIGGRTAVWCSVRPCERR